jgi:hypothetical protein
LNEKVYNNYIKRRTNLKHIALIPLMFLLSGLTVIHAQNRTSSSEIKRIDIPINSSRYYIIRYKDTKPDDVPQDIYDGLFEIQKEVVDNFTYSYDILYGRKRSPYGYAPTKEDYYKYGGGVCEDYSNFFILLAREKGLTENLYKVSGKGFGGHAWLEYRTAENVYIIDPTWSDDYAYSGSQTRQKFRESPAYGKEAFFITYAEDAIIFPRSNGYNHSSFTGKTSTPLWEVSDNDEQEADTNE